MQRDVRRPPTASRVERNGEGLQAEGAANSNAMGLEKGLERRSPVTCRLRWA